MKNKINILLALLPTLAISCVTACGKTPVAPEEYEIPRYEVGDTVNEWKSKGDYSAPPLSFPKESNKNKVEIVNDFGHDDDSSMLLEISGGASGYIGSNELEEPFFTDNDVKNGDIISMYVYVPSDGNVASLQMEVLPNSMNNGYTSKKLTIDNDNVEEWVRLVVSYDTLDTMGAIRLNYQVDDSSKPASFYIDDISVVYGEETVKNDYEYNDESLAERFKDYIKVGSIMSDGMYKNTKMRQILLDNFNSITAENEAKPERVLDQAACQELAKKDETAVAITTAPFEKIYDWCEAHHIPVRHHTFVWHQQTPNWFFNEGYNNNGKKVTRNVMLGRLHNYLETMIETLDERWPGLVYALDIVNEAIEEVDQIRRGNWMDTVGDDYIYQAFVAANECKKDYQDIYYNDYAFEQTQWGGKDRCQWAVDKMLKKAIDEELIDGIGIQGHIEFSDVDTILEDAKIIHEAGIKCQITELDINCDGEKDFEKQKEAYYKVVKSVLEGNEDDTMDVNAIIVWGTTDNTSWHSNRYPLLFNSNYGKKPAYYGFLQAIEDFEQGI